MGALNPATFEERLACHPDSFVSIISGFKEFGYGKQTQNGSGKRDNHLKSARMGQSADRQGTGDRP